MVQHTGCVAYWNFLLKRHTSPGGQYVNVFERNLSPPEAKPRDLKYAQTVLGWVTIPLSAPQRPCGAAPDCTPVQCLQQAQLSTCHQRRSIGRLHYTSNTIYMYITKYIYIYILYIYYNIHIYIYTYVYYTCIYIYIYVVYINVYYIGKFICNDKLLCVLREIS